MQIGIDTILSDIAADNRNGATALAARGLDAMAMLAEVLPGDAAEAEFLVIDLIRRLDSIRPSMGAIGVQAMLTAAKARAIVISTGTPWSDALRRAVRENRDNQKTADKDIAELLKNTLDPGNIIVTCSSSATVDNAISALEPTLVRIGEGHPLGDGMAAAKRLGQRNFNVVVVPDAALPTAVKGAMVALIGADQVQEDGSVINRCSSFSLSLAASYYKVPLYVVCQQIKRTGRTDVHLEESNDLFQSLPAGVTGYAPIFDITPPDLIYRIVTETGAMTPSAAGAKGKKVAKMLRRIVNTGKL
jgi:translation initiation factor 2B subunit (eIF-2B alpha/beta/delta family)